MNEWYLRFRDYFRNHPYRVYAADAIVSLTAGIVIGVIVFLVISYMQALMGW